MFFGPRSYYYFTDLCFCVTSLSYVYFASCQAELQLNFQKRKGHGVLSLLRPKFSGVLGEALDMAVRWSGDVVCD